MKDNSEIDRLKEELRTLVKEILALLLERLTLLPDPELFSGVAPRDHFWMTPDGVYHYRCAMCSREVSLGEDIKGSPVAISGLCPGCWHFVHQLPEPESLRDSLDF
jgi:DNA-directed RNA polymerase subunit RPC12/RpoP